MDLLTWLLVGGIVFLIAYIVLSIVLGLYLHKEYEKSKKTHANHAEKMAEMRKKFEEREKENKDKMNRFR